MGKKIGGEKRKMALFIVCFVSGLNFRRSSRLVYFYQDHLKNLCLTSTKTSLVSKYLNEKKKKKKCKPK